MIVKKAARICPAVASFTRYIDKPNEVAGYQWPAGTIFRINVEAIHYNKDYWEESDKFNHDGWLKILSQRNIRLSCLVEG